MITYVNKDNHAAYEKLYAEALTDLKKLDPVRYANTKIDSLESYFAHIVELLALTDPTDKRYGDTYGRKYSILPLQEEYFEIDANSRAIKIPESFSKNGLGVLGDHTAETIYFKVNRYFDAMDLYYTDIYIQWKNAEGAGFAKEWVRDIETFDDEMVFGWVLGSDTESGVPGPLSCSGPLQFSIHFVKTKKKNPDDPESTEKVVVYNLGTLTANAVVNSSLDFDIGVQNDELNNTLAGNFENTTTKTDTTILVFKFVYEFDNLVAAGGVEQDGVISADLNDDNELLMKVSAYADKGSMSYRIYKQKGAEEDIDGEDKELFAKMTVYYEETPDTHFQDNKIYYLENKANPDLTKKEDFDIALITEDEVGLPIPSDTNYYEEYGVYTLKENTTIKSQPITGYYYTTASAITADGAETSPLISTKKVLLSPPEKATIDAENQAAYVDGQKVGVELAPKFLEKTGKTSYIWSAKKHNQTEYTQVAEIEGEATYTPTEEAYYSVKVKTNRNLDSVLSDDEVIYCVTNKPKEAEINIRNMEGIDSLAANPSFGPMALYEPTNPLNNDYGLTYQWYKIVDGIEEIIANATNPRYSPTEVGNYKCKVTAHYNKLTATKETGIFVVVE